MGFTSKDENGVSTLVPEMDVTKLQPLLDPGRAGRGQRAGERHLRQRRHQGLGRGRQGRGATRPRGDRAGHHRGHAQAGDRTVEAVTKKKEPDLTTQEAKDMGISDLLSTYTTKYTGSGNRQVNVKITTKYATNVMLAPGEEYNFDKQIGPRTAARGYKLAPGIVGPQHARGRSRRRHLPGVDHDVQRVPSKPASRSPSGTTTPSTSPLSQGPRRDGDGGGKNLRFVNDTDHYIWIGASRRHHHHHHHLWHR